MQKCDRSTHNQKRKDFARTFALFATHALVFLYNHALHCILGGIPNCERKELLQATLNVIQDDFPNEAIVDIIEFDAFNRLDIFPVWFYDHKTKINLVESITFNYVQVSLDWKII